MYRPCQVAGCDHTTPVAEDPAMLRGPEVGTRVRYIDPKFPQWHDTDMRVKARSYVWSPEIHVGMNQHGYRNYDWTVVEWTGKNGRPTGMVVDDFDLVAVDEGD